MEIFADGIMNVVLTRGLIRIDWYSLSPTEEGPDGAPCPRFTHRLIVHPDNLPRVLDSLRLAMETLRARGAIMLPPAEDEETATADRTAADLNGDHPDNGTDGIAPAERPHPWSANFPSTVARAGEASA